jgi:hypothetical protein
MSDEVILHIGMGRCGSTAIQSFLFDNRRKLAAAGVAYPLSGRFGLKNNGRSSGNGTQIFHAIRRDAAQRDQIAAAVARHRSGFVLSAMCASRATG